MNKLLSIGIPTFDRAHELDRQLEWLVREIKGFEQECEITIYDNSSTDATPEVVEKWRPLFGSTPFKYIRNPQNIGGLPNYAKFLSEATGTFVWAIGDDDPINPGTLALIIKTLKEQRNLALMYLNFSGFYKPKGCVLEEHWFDTNLEPYASNGEAVFQHSIEKSLGAVIFITAAIYRTELVKVALRKWPESVDNWAGMGYWTGYCAMHGEVLVTKDNYVVCIIGDSHWEKDSKIHSRIYCKDVPELCYKLYELGYPYKMCRQVILNGFKHLESCNGNRTYLRAFRYWGTATAAALAFVLSPFHAAFQDKPLIPLTLIEARESQAGESMS